MRWEIKHFNELTINELYDILWVRSEVFAVEQQCAYLEVDGKDKDAYHIFCVDNDKIIACARILPKGVSYDEASIGRLLVHRDYRKDGLGRELLRRTIKFMEEELNEHEIRIGAQAYLLNFYKSEGFIQMSDVYDDDGIPHIEMLYKNNGL